MGNSWSKSRGDRAYADGAKLLSLGEGTQWKLAFELTVIRFHEQAHVSLYTCAHHEDAGSPCVI